MGTSNPVAIEAFMRANGMTADNEGVIYAGQDCQMPSAADYAASTGEMGQAVLDANNASINASNLANLVEIVPTASYEAMPAPDNTISGIQLVTPGTTVPNTVSSTEGMPSKGHRRRA